MVKDVNISEGLNPVDLAVDVEIEPGIGLGQVGWWCDWVGIGVSLSTQGMFVT